MRQKFESWIEITGILRVYYTPFEDYSRLKIVFSGIANSWEILQNDRQKFATLKEIKKMTHKTKKVKDPSVLKWS